MSFLWQIPARIVTALSPATKRTRDSNASGLPTPSPSAHSPRKRLKTASEHAIGPASPSAGHVTEDDIEEDEDTTAEGLDVKPSIEFDDDCGYETLEDRVDEDDNDDDDDDDDEEERTVIGEDESEDFEGTTLIENAAPGVEEPVPQVKTGQFSKEDVRIMREIKAKREAVADSLEGWSLSDKELLRKIHMRGFEPLLPIHMEPDFYSFPSALFTQNGREAFINTSGRRGGLTDYAQSARFLRDLVELGQRVRRKVYVNKPPEWIMRKQFEEYITWSLKDACLHKKKGSLPLISVTHGAAQVSSSELQSRMFEQLAGLARSWSRALDPESLDQDGLPPLYAIVVSFTVIGIVSYVAEGTGNHPIGSPSNHLRTIGTYHFHNADYDVWNAFAVAILVIHCRNKLIEVLESGRVPDYDGTDVVEDDEDPDAPL